MGVDEAGEEEAVLVLGCDCFGVFPFGFLALDILDIGDVFFYEGDDTAPVDADGCMFADFELGEGFAVHEGAEVDSFLDGG